MTIWTQVDHERDGVRLAISDSENGDVDVRLEIVRAEELGRALFLGGSAYGIEAKTVDGEFAVLYAAEREVSVTVADETPHRFVLQPAQARAFGEEILARPVKNEVECPKCGRRSWCETRLSPSSDVAEARAQSTYWTCPGCGHRVLNGDLVEDDDDVFRVRPANERPPPR